MKVNVAGDPSITLKGEVPEGVGEFAAVAGLRYSRRPESGVQHKRVKSV